MAFSSDEVLELSEEDTEAIRYYDPMTIAVVRADPVKPVSLAPLPPACQCPRCGLSFGSYAGRYA